MQKSSALFSSYALGVTVERNRQGRTEEFDDDTEAGFSGLRR